MPRFQQAVLFTSGCAHELILQVRVNLPWFAPKWSLCLSLSEVFGVGGCLGGWVFLSAASTDCGFVQSPACGKVCSSKNRQCKQNKKTSRNDRRLCISRIAKYNRWPVTPILGLLSVRLPEGVFLDWLASAAELGIRRSCSFYLCVHTSQGRVLSSRSGFVWSWYLLRQLVFALRIVGSSFK